jgi:prevent-host-death family protein
MKELAVFEAKTRLSELLAAVEQGEQFVITRRGVAVARLVSASPTVVRRSRASSQRTVVAKAFADMKSLRAGVNLDAPLRDVIDQGRD